MDHFETKDHFEEQLAHLMRSSQEYAPFEPRHRARLHEAVRIRRRLRAARTAAGSVLAVGVLALALALRPDGTQQVEPSSPAPAPTTSPTTSVSGPLPTSEPPTSVDTSTATPTDTYTDAPVSTSPPVTQSESESLPPPETSITP
ncbi:hypothetical protein STRCI_006712 [Streptomyces cinnabarinus]|uniref:Cellulase n=1 Tax=Streptomyces cinnabarinus TaxID=67287 RepID=A0ABY7KL02_9ACTN|nr:hypothetical protein [Streptomyces cinnabarinus]WAZ25231.1 hypothetical protein STRCI_006712 [Streptomyces cinnabarinus]